MMQNRSELYQISEPEAPAPSNVISIGTNPVPPPHRRERSWRNLMRRLQKHPAPRKPLS
jgi:hypothetical protein